MLYKKPSLLLVVGIVALQITCSKSGGTITPPVIPPLVPPVVETNDIDFWLTKGD